MYAISSLLLVVAVSLIVTRIATVILVASGLSHEAARFQAHSAFTGAGFTTTESESVVNHPLRRKVVMILMLLGNAGIVAAASTLNLGFRGGGSGSDGFRVLELVAGLMALVLISRSNWADRKLTGLISHFLRQYTDLATRDLDEGVAVLGITRAGGHYQGSPIGSTRILPGDTLVLYGQAKSLEEIDHRSAGAVGDLGHETAVARQTDAVRLAHSRDPASSASSSAQNGS